MSDSLLKSIALAIAVTGHLLLGLWLSALQPAPQQLKASLDAPRTQDRGEALTVVFVEPNPSRDTRPSPPMPVPPEHRKPLTPPRPAQQKPVDSPVTAQVAAPVMTPPAAVSEPAPAAPTETVAETQTADNTPPNPAPVVSAPASEGPPISPARAKRERDAWLRELMAWLVKHRVYPEEAKKDKAQGIVHVRFSIDRNGNLLAASIDKGLGYAPLDRAALDVLHRASPMPPLPRAITSDRVTLTLPIEFSLRTE